MKKIILLAVALLTFSFAKAQVPDVFFDSIILKGLTELETPPSTTKIPVFDDNFEIVGWTEIGNLPSDDLGSHIATQNINLNGNDLDFSFNGYGLGFSGSTSLRFGSLSGFSSPYLQMYNQGIGITRLFANNLNQIISNADVQIDLDSNNSTTDSSLSIVRHGFTIETLEEIFNINESGKVSFLNYSYPVLDGSANQVLVTDGLGNLDWEDYSSGNSSQTLNDVVGEGDTITSGNDSTTLNHTGLFTRDSVDDEGSVFTNSRIGFVDSSASLDFSTHLTRNSVIIGNGTAYTTLSNANVTANRTAEFQDKDGTVAYLDDVGIPLSGTGGSPVTGDIVIEEQGLYISSFDTNNVVEIFDDGGSGLFKIGVTDADEKMNLNPFGFFIRKSTNKDIRLTQDLESEEYLKLNFSNYSNPLGIVGADDFSINYASNDNAYTQVNYVNGIVSTASITGTEDIDWKSNVTTRVYTLTGATTFTESNLQPRVLTFIVTGDFDWSPPSTWTGYSSNDDYDGLVDNHIIVECIVDTLGSEKIYYSLKNM
ncbi:hypothetical protein [Winogradskyella forsetii]|uniref:hypothetical protein n=1 Tax=Winogradskyella forsetii TaxID=2686077 RepID=UPI0015C0B865|nr:hypothetical protein [Winogradskyella forsetii]